MAIGDLVKIALVNTIKPQEGSRDGMTEYAYQLYQKMKKGHKVDLVYVTDKSKRVDNAAFIYANTFFKMKIKALAAKGYDVVHIANQELGFVAKILKEAKTNSKVVTTVHDLMRLKSGSYKSIDQRIYSKLVSGSILDCFKYSDQIIFSGSNVSENATKAFGRKNNWAITFLGPSEEFRSTLIPKKPRRKEFVVGYVGALAFWKNPMYVARTAKLLKDDESYRFMVYGNGPEDEKLRSYKDQNGLDNLTINPFPSQDRFLSMYDSFDLFFYPTTEEGSSLPLINAQCRGLPVVMYKGNHIDAEVKKYCFVSKDEKDAARIIGRIKTKGFNKRYRKTMTDYARSFSWGKTAKETIAIYNRLLK